MSNITYVSLSQATALQRHLNMTAHNLANSTTAGYKTVNPLLESVETGFSDDDVNYVQDGGAYLDLKTGTLVPTGNTFDLAISGNGWMAFQLEAGDTGYSRHGRLILDVDGQLKTSSGRPILGAGGAPITLPDDVGQDVTISTGGTITDRTGAVLGTIGVVTIEKGADMVPLGGGMYLLPEDAATPQQAAEPGLKQGFVENSNVEAVLEMTRLIDIQRAYENSVKLMNQDDDLRKNVIDRLGATA